MNRLLAIIACLLLAACEPDTTTKVARNQPPDERFATTYRYNGEVEGCQLYHVKPRYGSNDFHFVKCGSSTTTALRESCGKNCSRDVAVRTEGVE